ncbi:MAG: hypothetical protein KGI54_10520 [Pseudomonadota bacterium]|nr:hypothetical protein [Pseudomonadota bacterium]
MTKQTGGPAFPQPINPAEQGRGLTLRDYFAAKAMQGLISNWGKSNYASDDARYCYEIADAMLEARK